MDLKFEINSPYQHPIGLKVQKAQGSPGFNLLAFPSSPSSNNNNKISYPTKPPPLPLPPIS
jgi:hypothetical protein